MAKTTRNKKRRHLICTRDPDMPSFVYIGVSHDRLKVGWSDYPLSRMRDLRLEPPLALHGRTDLKDTAKAIEKILLSYARLLSGRLRAKERDSEWFPIEYMPAVHMLFELIWNNVFPKVPIRTIAGERPLHDALDEMYRRVDAQLVGTPADDTEDTEDQSVVAEIVVH